MKNKLTLLLSISFGIIFFLLMLPIQFSIYIPEIHSAISIALIAASSILFSVVIYKLINKTLLSNNIITLLCFLIILGIAHSIYTVMFWSSWICLGLILIILITIGILYLKSKIKNKHINRKEDNHVSIKIKQE